MASKAEKIAAWTRQAMPDDYFKKAQVEFREFYYSNLEIFHAAEETFRNLVTLLLTDKDFPAPKVTSRLKDRNECIRKFDTKYRLDCEHQNEEYKISDHITDIIGIRVICIYESDIDKVASVLCDQFTLIEKTDKIKIIEKSDREFGYKGIHLDLCLDRSRQKLPEHKAFSGQRFEVQIRTIVQDAWSEIDHRLKYKKDIPQELRRRIHRLAALFELADQEFESVKDQSNQLMEAAKSIDYDEAGSVLDPFGFTRVADSVFPKFVFGGENLDDLLGSIKEANPEISVKEFREALEGHISKIKEYKEYLSSIGTNMGPYTQIRHCMYFSNPNLYGGLIFSGHRKNVDRWLKHGTVFPHEMH